MGSGEAKREEGALHDKPESVDCTLPPIQERVKQMYVLENHLGSYWGNELGRAYKVTLMVTNGAALGISIHCILSHFRENETIFQFRLKKRDSHSFGKLRTQFCEIPGGLAIILFRKVKGNHCN